jgi:hypothetical protein
MNNKLIAVLSTESAGSTLLSMMLAGSPSLLSPPELHILRWEKVEDWQANYPVAMGSVEEIARQLGAQRPEVLEPDPEQTTASYYATILDLCAHSNAILVDKTPAYALDRRVLERLESFNPFYIWLIRHPLGVAASAIARKAKRPQLSPGLLLRPKKMWRRLFFERYRQSMYRCRLSRWLDHWRTANGNILELMQTIDSRRYAVMHFEELLADPGSCMRELSAQMGVRYSKAMLDPWNNAPESVQWGVGSGKVHDFDRFDTARTKSWQRVYSEADLPGDVADLYRQLSLPDATPSRRTPGDVGVSAGLVQPLRGTGK